MSEALALLVQEDEPTTVPSTLNQFLDPAHAWLAEPGDRRIGTSYDFRIAAETLVEVRRTLRLIAAKHDPAVKAKYAEHRAATAARQAEEGQLPQAEAALAEKVGAYLRVYAIDNDSLALADQLPVVEGLGWATNYRYVIKNFRKLVRAVARGSAPIEALAPNDAWLRERVKRMRETFVVPGVAIEIVVVPAVTKPEKVS